MASFIIEGGHALNGTIRPQGAKNEALQIIAATLLTSEEVIVRNVPDILDVNNLIKLVAHIGVKVTRLDSESYSFRADDLNEDFIKSDEFLKQSRALRGSVLLLSLIHI